VGTDDIYLHFDPHEDNLSHDHLPFLDSTPIIDTVCHHLTQTSKDLPEDSKTVDNLLRSLQKYYNEVKTRRQLNLNVPAGF
jgi:hypothetical protein